MGECLLFPLEHTAGATVGDVWSTQRITRLFYTGSCGVPLKGSMPRASALPFDTPSFFPPGTASQPVTRATRGKSDE